MAHQYVLALDLGSSAIRAAVVSEDWLIVGEAESSFIEGRGHFAPADFRERVLGCLGSAVRAAKVPAIDVAQIAVIAQRGGVAFIDTNGKPVATSPNTDVVAVFQGASLDEQFGSEIYATTGHLPSMFFAPAKLHWWRENHARLSRRIATIASLGSWAVYQLTGEFGETPSTLVESGLADVTSGSPASGLLAKLDISLDSLPSIVTEGSVIGNLSREAGDSTGLRPGIPVALAGPDAQVTSLGAGSVRPGDTAVIAGWSAPVQRVTAQPRFDSARRTWVGRHAIADRWVTEANPGDTGRTLEMIRRMLDPEMTLSRFDRLAQQRNRQELPVIAAWGPRALDLSNPGMSIGGIIAPSPITYEGISAAAVARATIDNIAFAIRECESVLDDVAGKSVGPLILTGGMANSRFFPHLLAKVVGRPVRRQSPRAGAIGAALVSTLPASDLVAAAGDVASRGITVTPAPEDVRDAAERYERWLYVRGKLDALAEEL